MSVESPPDTLLGSGFRPKDEEVVHYLRLKKAGKDSLVDNAIAEVDFYKSPPWDLPHKSRLNSDDQTWYFFHRQVHMDTGYKRIKRKTPRGTWKLTGKDRKIKNRNGNVIGSKRYFVFLPDGARRTHYTKWIMHEYSEPSDLLSHQTNYVICRLEERIDKKSDTLDSDEGGPSGDIMSDLPVAPAAAPWEHGHLEENQGLSQQPFAPNIDGGQPSFDFTSHIEDPAPPLSTLVVDNCKANVYFESFDDLPPLLSPDWKANHDFANFLPSDFYDGYNEIQASCDVPDENGYGQKIQSPFNETSQPTTLKWNCILDCPVSSDTDAKGVGVQVKGHTSFISYWPVIPMANEPL